MTKYIGLFFGPNKIKLVEPVERKTYMGGDVVKLTFENNGVKEIPLDMLESVATKEKKDLTELQILKVNPLISKILALLTDAELNSMEIRYALGPRLEASLNQTKGIAEDILWGKDHDQITLHDIDQVLKRKND